MQRCWWTPRRIYIQLPLGKPHLLQEQMRAKCSATMACWCMSEMTLQRTMAYMFCKIVVLMMLMLMLLQILVQTGYAFHKPTPALMLLKAI